MICAGMSVRVAQACLIHSLMIVRAPVYGMLGSKLASLFTEPMCSTRWELHIEI